MGNVLGAILAITFVVGYSAFVAAVIGIIVYLIYSALATLILRAKKEDIGPHPFILVTVISFIILVVGNYSGVYGYVSPDTREQMYYEGFRDGVHSTVDYIQDECSPSEKFIKWVDSLNADDVTWALGGTNGYNP